ncbi:Uncharacterised protein [Mycobacteroides abscessus]|nr:Uncharacterised protein [Mycobacteroides abscessus]
MSVATVKSRRPGRATAARARTVSPTATRPSRDEDPKTSTAPVIPCTGSPKPTRSARIIARPPVTLLGSSVTRSCAVTICPTRDRRGWFCTPWCRIAAATENPIPAMRMLATAAATAPFHRRRLSRTQIAPMPNTAAVK